MQPHFIQHYLVGLYKDPRSILVNAHNTFKAQEPHPIAAVRTALMSRRFNSRQGVYIQIGKEVRRNQNSKEAQRLLWNVGDRFQNQKNISY